MASMALAQGVLFHLMSYVSDTSGIAEVILFREMLVSVENPLGMFLFVC